MGSAGINFGKPNEEFIIESNGSGALTSARNAVTGDEYTGGAKIEKFTGTFRIRNSVGALTYVSLSIVSDTEKYITFVNAIAKDALFTFNTAYDSKIALIDGIIILGTLTVVQNITISGGTIEKIANTTPAINGWRITPTAANSTVELTLLAS